MSVKAFLKALFGGTTSVQGRPRHSGDDLADDIAETMGPQAGHRITGNALYKRLEDRSRD